MIGIDDVIITAAVSSAATSVAALVAALYQRRHAETVRVAIDGKAFTVENVDPNDIDAVLADVKRQVTAAQGDSKTLATAGD